MLFVAVIGWVSVCLLLASWFPDLSDELRILWMISGVTGLVSAIGLSEVIKADVRVQEKLLHEYMQAASMDGLTGLANRQALDRALASALSGFDDRRNPLTVIMFDIDHFKSVNDRFGHQAGDEVLKAVARVLIDSARNTDFAARYGGEEFCLVMPGADPDTAMEKAEEMRAKIEEMVVHSDEAELKVTMSVGISSFDPEVDVRTNKGLINRADKALYVCKRAGRNRVMHYSPDMT